MLSRTVFLFLLFSNHVLCQDEGGFPGLYPIAPEGNNWLGTRIFGFENCGINTQTIKYDYDDMHRIASTEGVYRNVAWGEAAAHEYFGPGLVINSGIRRSIEVKYSYPSAQIVRCDDPKKLCADPCDPERASKNVNAYAAQDDGKKYPQINFCPQYFELRSLGGAISFGLSQVYARQRFDLDTYINRASVFYHEVSHLTYFINSPPYICDWEIYLEVKKDVYQWKPAYQARFTKILARAIEDHSYGYYSGQSADNYANFALAKYVKANGLGDHPFYPVLAEITKPKGSPRMLREGVVVYNLDDEGVPVFNEGSLGTDPASCSKNEVMSTKIKGFAKDSDYGTPYTVEHRGWLANSLLYEVKDLELRILPLGDSITNGFQSSNGNGYREGLVKALSGNRVDLVGSVHSGSMADNDHEGHNGYIIDEISAAVTHTLSQRPNVVLLHAGTNDMDKNINPEDAPNRLGRLIDKITAACPDAVIFVSKLIPSSNENTQARIVDFNTALPEIVGKRVSAGYKVFLMDGYSPLSFVANDFADSLHPNDQGYGKLATAWYNAIAFADNQLGWISKPVAGGGTRPHLIPCDKNPIWIPNGEIANGAGLGQDLYPYLTCGEKRGDEGTCVCGSRTDGPTGSGDMDVPKEGSNCHDMSYDPTHAVHFADLDGDGRAEFLWVGSKGEVTAFYNQGPPGGQQSTNGAQVGWWPAGVIASGVGATPYQVHFADLNGDGRAEYIHVHRNGSASVWLNQGQYDGGKTPANVGWYEQGLVASGIGAPDSTVRFADLNGDGRAEYISVNSKGAATVYLNLGPKPGSDPRGAQVAWLPQKQTAMGVGGERHQTMFADINGDGKADYLFFPNYPPLGSGDGGRGNVQMWRNGGGPDDGPHAAEPVWYPDGEIATGDGTPPYQVMFADLNGDGRAEYIEVDRDTSAVKAYLNACPK
ncbi:hypothetical protein MferCBS49748_006466 [Microsporum ferrugineum]